MNRLKKILIWLLVIATVLIIGIFITASIYIKSFKPDFEKALTENIGMETRIDGPISLKILPGISFIANDIKIISNETYLVRMEKVEISINYLGVFGAGTKINQLHFIKPQVYVVRETDGSFNFAATKDDLNLVNPTAIKSYKINLKALSIQDGILFYFDKKNGDTLRAEGINMQSDRMGLSGTARNINAKKFSFEGDLAITHFKLNLLNVDSLNFKVAGRGGKISIQPVDSDYFGGKSSGKAIIDFTPPSPLIQIQHQMIGLDIRQFQETNQTPNILEGKLNYNLDISFQSFDWEKVSKSLSGSIIVDGKNLTLNGVHVEKSLKRFNDTDQFSMSELGVLFFAGPFRAVFTKTMDFSEIEATKGKTNVDQFVSRWTVSKGVASSQDVSFSNNKYRFALNGKLDFISRSYKNLNISMLNRDGCAVLTERLNGPFVNPETTTITEVESIENPVGNFYKSLAAPSDENCTEVYSGSVKHPGL